MGRRNTCYRVVKSILEQIGKRPGRHGGSGCFDATNPCVPWRCRRNYEKLMKKEGVLAAFEKLSYTHRKEVLPLDHRGKEGRDASGPHHLRPSQCWKKASKDSGLIHARI